jgi:hypothetical protein
MVAPLGVAGNGDLPCGGHIALLGSALHFRAQAPSANGSRRAESATCRYAATKRSNCCGLTRNRAIPRQSQACVLVHIHQLGTSPPVADTQPRSSPPRNREQLPLRHPGAGSTNQTSGGVYHAAFSLANNRLLVVVSRRGAQRGKRVVALQLTPRDRARIRNGNKTTPNIPRIRSRPEEPFLQPFGSLTQKAIGRACPEGTRLEREEGCQVLGG